VALIRACNIDKPTTEVFEKISQEYFNI